MENRKRDYALDFLKIAATILIVLHHYQQESGTMFTDGINFFGGSFDFGAMVELFFLLSGYFMLEYGEKIRSGLTLKAFYGKRMIRLLPMVAVSTAAAELLLFAYNSLYGAKFIDLMYPSLWALLTDCLGVRTGWVFDMYGANNPTWYVSVLMLCYLLFYLLNKLSKRWNISVTYLYAGMVLLGCGVASYGLNLPFLNGLAARGYYAFFTGVLLAGLLRGQKITFPMAAASVVALAVFAAYALYDFSTIGRDVAYLLTFLVYPAMVILCETELAKKIFSSKLWGSLSEISFDVYLWHTPLMIAIYVVMKLTGSQFDFASRGNMLLFLLMAEILGAIFHYCLEKPLGNYMARFFK